MNKTGHCLCGAVSFVAENVPTEFGVCHCEMCRRWIGSALLGVNVKDEGVKWSGEAHIARRQTSSWAERAWCRECGTGLWFKVTMEGLFSGGTEIPIGLFDDPNGFEMTNEIYIDHKPDSFAYAGEERKVLTRAECVEKFSVLDGE